MTSRGRFAFLAHAVAGRKSSKPSKTVVRRTRSVFMQLSYMKKPGRTGTGVVRAGRVGDTRRFSSGGLITVGHSICPYDGYDKAITTARLSINVFFISFLTSTEGRYKDLLVRFSQTVVQILHSGKDGGCCRTPPRTLYEVISN
jgi:hypothetical protein